MLVSEIATRVRRQFGDEAGVEITDADIIRWVNDAQREIAVRNNLLQVRATAGAVNGQAEYSIPANLVTLHTVLYQNRKLQPLSIQEANDLINDGTATGIPTHFWQFAGIITLYPAPDTTDPDDIKLLYTRTATEITALDQTPEVPVTYHNRIVEYVMAQAAELDENLNRYQLKMGEFQTGMLELKDAPEWEKDVYPSITAGPADYSYYDSNHYID
ncbi:MAG TPA: DUF6682 family protein [Patescibacteria group bacterium]|nr:DUF6682 family protein [Patescibacteria group bacterium]